jgi:LPXTG-motif cell wall-anchored protein
MKRFSAILVAGLMVGLFAVPAFAQPSPVDEVLPIDFERPPAAVVDPAPVAPQIVTPAGVGQLAVTGSPVTVGLVLAVGLLTLGGAALFVSRRRRVTGAP